jgi:hypothetical protein
MVKANFGGRTEHRPNNGRRPNASQDLMFAQYWKHPEFKSLAPDGTPCKGDTRGLPKRCSITASGIKLIGKETERGWEQDDDISTLLPSLVRYDKSDGPVRDQLREKLQRISIDALHAKTGLSRNTLLRARRRTEDSCKIGACATKSNGLPTTRYSLSVLSTIRLVEFQ